MLALTRSNVNFEEPNPQTENCIDSPSGGGAEDSEVLEGKLVKSMVLEEQKEGQALSDVPQNPVYLSYEQTQAVNIERSKSKTRANGQLSTNQKVEMMARQAHRSRSPNTRNSNLEISPIKLKPPKLSK